MRSRIKAQRAKIRGTNDATRLSENFKTNKRRLARMIRRSKERCQKEFCVTLGRVLGEVVYGGRV